MEIILSILFLAGIWAYFKCHEAKACRHCNSYMIDYGKLNDDRMNNNLSNFQVNQNIINGKYDKGRIPTKAEIKASQEAYWEDFKKCHPHGKWN